MPLRITLLVLAILAIAAGPAQADITVSNVNAKPANMKAGASSDFTLSFDLGGSESIRDLDLNLPAGLIGNPNNAAQCSQADFNNDSCPAASKVGTQTVNVTVAGLLPSNASGEVFNLAPDKPEPAQLGIKLTDATGGVQHLKSDVSVRPSDSGLTSTIRGIPNTANGLSVHINSISLTLQAKSGANKAFMTNPTSCDPAPTTLHVVGDGNSPADGNASFTPTDCGALPFAPKLTATVGANGSTAAHSSTPLTTVITQQPGEANTKEAKVTLLAPLGPNVGALSNVCKIADFDADTCPAASIVGHAQAITPLLATPLSGPVRIVEVGPNSLPKVVVYLNGTINVRLTGVIGLPAAGTETTFQGIPDVPLSRFQLDFSGGANALVGTNADLCKKVPGIQGLFTAHSGATKTVTITPTVKGCPKTKPPAAGPRPVGSALLSRLAGNSPTLKVGAKRRSGGKRLAAMSVALPSGLSFDRGTLSAGVKAGKGVRATLGGTRLLRLRAQSVAGLTSIAATVRNGALKVSPALRGRVRKHPKVTIVLRIAEVGGRVTTLRKSVALR
jgi:hypothetical protein